MILTANIKILAKIHDFFMEEIKLFFVFLWWVM